MQYSKIQMWNICRNVIWTSMNLNCLQYVVETCKNCLETTCTILKYSVLCFTYWSKTFNKICTTLMTFFWIHLFEINDFFFLLILLFPGKFIVYSRANLHKLHVYILQSESVCEIYYSLKLRFQFNMSSNIAKLADWFIQKSTTFFQNSNHCLIYRRFK